MTLNRDELERHKGTGRSRRTLKVSDLDFTWLFEFEQRVSDSEPDLQVAGAGTPRQPQQPTGRPQRLSRRDPNHWWLWRTWLSQQQQQWLGHIRGSSIVSSASLSLMLFLRVVVLEYLPHEREQIIELLISNKYWLSSAEGCELSSSRLRFSGPALQVCWVLLSIVDGYLLAGFSKCHNSMMCSLSLVWWVVLVKAVPKTSPKQVELDVARLPVNHAI